MLMANHSPRKLGPDAQYRSDRFFGRFLASLTVLAILSMTVASNAQVCPAGTIVDADPAPGTIDARQPHELGDPLILLGIGGDAEPITVMIDHTQAAKVPPNLACWSLCETGDDGRGANSITTAELLAQVGGLDQYRITLDRPITPGEATVITYQGDPVNLLAYRSHPANANGDLLATVVDLSALINFINAVAVPPYGIHSTDIDHSGTTDAEDIARAIDLLNGINSFSVWIT